MPYRFELSLRLRHPRITAEQISAGLNLTPRYSWTVGQPRLRRDGVEITHSNAETYWSLRVENGSADLVSAIDTAVTQLEERRAFIQEFLNSGGSIDLFIGWFLLGQSGGESLPSELLHRLGTLGIDLALDVYGEIRPVASP
jgi:hypothetical protein